MADTYSANLKLGTPAAADRLWNVELDRNRAILDALSAVGGLAVSPHEVPSTSLSVDVAAGSYQKQDGTIGTYAGASGQAIAASSTKVLYLDLVMSGALTVAAAYPTTAHVRLASVVTSGSVVTSIVDARVAFQVVGSFVDGTVLAAGTSTGLKIGGATTKLGFFGATPVVQPTLGATSAGATYTAAEQAILNKVVVALRALGLGS